MDVVIDLLFWVHMVSLALGGAASFGIPVVGGQLASAAPEARPTLFKIAQGLSRVGRIGLGGLLISGPLLVWLKFGGTAGFTWWFWLKMALVAILLVVVIASGINAKQAQGGDMVAARRGPVLGTTSIVLLLAILFTAVFAFG